MTPTLTLNIATPIGAVKMVQESDPAEEKKREEQQRIEALNAERQRLSDICGMLEKASQEVKQFHNDIFSTQSEQIAKLSVSIAEKILLQEIGERRYEIEKIIQEALKNAPSQHGVTVRLNPEDLEVYQKSVKEGGKDVLANVKLVSDPNISSAQCVVETDKGMIEYFIEQHLQLIGEALKGSVEN
jgi:flagellar biosynthesis/type III secretory pathway protein FliH